MNQTKNDGNRPSSRKNAPYALGDIVMVKPWLGHKPVRDEWRGVVVDISGLCEHVAVHAIDAEGRKLPGKPEICTERRVRPA